jgi:hypothetical protein
MTDRLEIYIRFLSRSTCNQENIARTDEWTVTYYCQNRTPMSTQKFQQTWSQWRQMPPSVQNQTTKYGIATVFSEIILIGRDKEIVQHIDN